MACCMHREWQRERELLAAEHAAECERLSSEAAAEREAAAREAEVLQARCTDAENAARAALAAAEAAAAERLTANGKEAAEQLEAVRQEAEEQLEALRREAARQLEAARQEAAEQLAARPDPEELAKVLFVVCQLIGLKDLFSFLQPVRPAKACSLPANISTDVNTKSQRNQLKQCSSKLEITQNTLQFLAIYCGWSADRKGTELLPCRRWSGPWQRRPRWAAAGRSSRPSMRACSACRPRPSAQSVVRRSCAQTRRRGVRPLRACTPRWPPSRGPPPSSSSNHRRAAVRLHAGAGACTKQSWPPYSLS